MYLKARSLHSGVFLWSLILSRNRAKETWKNVKTLFLALITCKYHFLQQFLSTAQKLVVWFAIARVFFLVSFEPHGLAFVSTVWFPQVDFLSFWRRKEEKSIIEEIIYRVICLLAHEIGTRSLLLITAVLRCRPVVWDHPGSLAVVGGAPVRNSEFLTAFPKPTDAEAEFCSIHVTLWVGEEIAAFVLLTSILTSYNALFGCKMIKMVFGKTRSSFGGGGGTGACTLATSRGKDIWEKVVACWCCGAEDVSDRKIKPGFVRVHSFQPRLSFG